MLNFIYPIKNKQQFKPFWVLSLILLCCGSYSVSYAQNDLSLEVVRTTSEQAAVGSTVTFKVKVVNQGKINFGYNTYPTTAGTLPKVKISIPAGLQLNSIGAYPITTYSTYAGAGTVTGTNASLVFTDASPASNVSSVDWTLDATAVGLLNANEALEITMDLTVRPRNTAVGATNSGEGVHTLKAEITQSLADMDSTPNNGLPEDDLAFACATSPYQICAGATRSIVLTANAGFVGVSGTSVTPAAVNPMVNTSSLTGVTYQWSRSPDGVAAYTNISGATSSTYTVTGTSTGFYKYTITFNNPTSGQAACTMTSCCPLIVNDVANPTLAAIAPQTICLNQSATLTAVASSGTTPYTYSWTNPTNGGLSGTTGASVTATPTVAGTFNYPVTVSDAYSCTATTTATVTVNPRPTVTSAATYTICSGTAMNYTLTSSVVGTTYNWTRAAVAGISNAAATNQTSNPITETLINTTAAPITVTYSVTPTAASCAGTVFTLTVTVNPSPTVSSAATATVCSGVALNYNITSATTGATFSWSRAAVAGISNAAATNQTADPIAEALVNTTTAPVTVTYTITPSANGCSGAAFTLTVTVNPTPTVSSSATATVCSGIALSYDITSATSGTTYSWSRAAVAGISNAAAANQTSDPITETLVNTTTAPVTVTYTITPTANGCTGTVFTLTVTVNPTPTVSSAATKTICSGTSVAYDITSATAGATFSWSRAAVAGISNAAATNQTADPIAEILTNTTAAPVTVTYTITPTANGCTGTVFTLTVTVNPSPTVSSAATATVCSGVALSYDITSATSGTTYSWSRAVVAGISNAAATNQTSDPITETLINTTTAPVTVTYTITPSANGCSGAAFTLTVTVNPTPTVSSSATATVCSGIALSYDITSATSGTTYSWSRAVVAGISNAAATNQTADPITETLINTTAAPVTVTYTITPTANGCTGTVFTLTVTVNPTPTVSSAATATVCSGTALSYNITSATAGATFSWSRAVVAGISNAAATNQTADPIAETLINTTTAPVTVTYTITPTANGCTGTVFTLTVTVNPSPTVSSAATATVCSGVALNYDITSATSGTTYSWSRAVVAGISNAAATNQTSDPITEALVNTTTAPVTVTYTITPSANGCSGAAFTLTVTVNPTPTVSSAATATVCSGTALSYNITSATAGATFSWSRAAVAGISNAAATNQTADPIAETLINTTAAPVTVTYTITPTANGCTGTVFTLTVTVNPTPTVSSAATATVCSGTALSYDITSATTGTTYSWSRAAVAGISNAAATNQTADPITETLINTTAAPVTVTYTITPTANGCIGTVFTLTVTVNPSPTVSSAATKTICSNTSVAYTITSATAGTTFSWSRAAVAGISNAAVTGQTANPIAETLVNTTAAPINVIYSITPSANGCSGAAFTLTVTVNPTPTVSSAATATVCSGTALSYDITSATTGTTYSWSRAVVAGISNAAATNQTSDPITETLVNTTTAPVTVTYTITPTANGCTGTVFTLTVTVNPTPTVTSAATATVCSGTALSYDITSATSGTTYSWSRAVVAGISNAAATNQTADPITETLINTTAAPVTVTYTITPTANGCTGTVFTLTVTVNPSATISSAASKTICSGSSVAYTITSATAGATFSWSRATVAGISNAAVTNQTANPITESLINTTASPVTVTYTITPTANGCTGATFSLSVIVNPAPVANAGADVTLCGGSSTQIGTTAVVGNTYAWSPAGTLTSATVSNPIATPASTTTYTVTVTVTATGCTAVDDVTVTVNPKPTVNAGADVTICYGGNTTLVATPTGGTPSYSYSWTPTATLSSGTIANPVASPTVTTTYTVIISDSKGCTNSDNVVVTVHNPGIVTNPAPSCKTDSDTTIDLNSNIAGEDAGGTWSTVSITSYTGSGTAPSTIPTSSFVTGVVGVVANAGKFNYKGLPPATYTLRYTAGTCFSDVVIVINNCCPPAICLPISSTRN